MGIKLPKKGSVCWIDLVDTVTSNEIYKGVQIGIQHVGPKEARSWAHAYQRLQLNEAKRMAGERKGLTKEQAPELWGVSALTPEGMIESEEMIQSVYNDCVAGVRGIDDVKDTDNQGAIAFLDYLELSERLKIVDIALRQQSLQKEQFFRSTGSSDVGPQPVAESN